MESNSQLLEILIENKFISPKQVDYGRRVRSRMETSRPLLDILKGLKYVTDEQIKEALRLSRVSIDLGSILVDLGYITEENLKNALNIQKGDPKKRKLGEILVEQKLIDEQILLEFSALQMGLPLIDPDPEKIDRDLLSKAPLKWYQAHNLIPIKGENRGVLVAFADPLDSDVVKAAEQLFETHILRAIASKTAIHRALQKLKSRLDASGISTSDENSVIRLVENLIAAAIEREASDIHIEPLTDRLRVRFREDGVLNHFDDYSIDLIPPITSRIKVMCDVDITERRRHQGGRFNFDFAGDPIDVRASFYVTVHGEKIVLRLLNRQGQLLSVKELGLAPKILKRFQEQALYLPSGVILITGPTGSGKTTTVYSCINHINNPHTSIITAEDPVEYVIEGISQCSINPKINLTYEETLRHIVRQDPDVIVIGEIRDQFSAEIAVQAALTGHKVITTFHTEDSIGGLIRLLNMNIEGFLISSTVISVMAQRLLRRICPFCEEPDRPTVEELSRIGYTPNDIFGANFRKGGGCKKCQYTGYKGRIGVFELLVLDEFVRDAIIQRKTSHEIRMISLENTGIVTLLEDGVYKASSGRTTIDEILRCLPKLSKPRQLIELRRLLGD
jgi:type IV pilus assembly protein PilB